MKEDELKIEKQLQDLRVSFNLSIARIFKPASQDKGLSECINAFKINNDDIRCLKVFIKALTDKSILTGNYQATSLCLHASLFGELAKVYKTKFVEPFDRPRTSEKLYDRILKFMVADIFITGQ